MDILEQPQVTDDTQVSQNLLFRYSWGNLITLADRGHQKKPRSALARMAVARAATARVYSPT